MERESEDSDESKRVDKGQLVEKNETYKED